LTTFLCGLILVGCSANSERAGGGPEGSSKSYLFCFWNVENLFDDHVDGRTNKADREFDRWFAEHPQILQLKLEHLSKALIEMNQGKGPDIVALTEVESVRAAELLREALNSRLENKDLHYEYVLMKERNAGRHIAPAIITRLPVRRDKTRLHGRALRILEAHIVVNNHDLVILASHWTSRVTDKQGDSRAKYGDQIYGVFNGMHKSNPKVDLLVCGDFNDPPDAPAITKHLRATGNIEAVRRSDGDPLLLDLFADKDAHQFGTHYFGENWFIFDQIAVSPGMLDSEGWSCDPATAQTVNHLSRPNDRRRRPWHFGGENEKFSRGYSDHFPITVQLAVLDE
jgi:endonuclease/exonuclease/phosphatase family metal-dependent hydrolase